MLWSKVFSKTQENETKSQSSLYFRHLNSVLDIMTSTYDKIRPSEMWILWIYSDHPGHLRSMNRMSISGCLEHIVVSSGQWRVKVKMLTPYLPYSVDRNLYDTASLKGDLLEFCGIFLKITFRLTSIVKCLSFNESRCVVNKHLCNYVYFFVRHKMRVWRFFYNWASHEKWLQKKTKKKQQSLKVGGMACISGWSDEPFLVM